MYREVHFDSRSQSRSLGDNNQPTFMFNDPLYLNKYAIKTAQIPLSYYNCYKTEDVFGADFYDDSDVLDFTHEISIPAGLYYYSNVSGYNGYEVIDSVLPEPVGLGGVWSVINGDTAVGSPTYSKIGLKFIAPPGTPGNTSQVQVGVYCDTIFARILGYHITDATTTRNGRPYFLGPRKVFDAVALSTANDFANADFTTNPTKFSTLNSLYLRSDMAHGAHYLPNSTSTPNYSMSNVLARIPIKTAEYVRGGNAIYDVGTLDPMTMFTFDGKYLDKATFWFTYPETDDVVDFRNKNFTFSLGIIS